MAEIIVMPKLNLTMEEGVIVDWCKKLGDTVKKDELLCNIETEKAVAEMESPAEGVLLKTFAVIGERYPVKTPIAIIGKAGEDISALVAQVEKQLAGGIPETQAAPVASVTPIVTESRVQVKMLPKVRKMAQELGIDLAALAAFTGDRKITEEDVLAFQKGNQTKPAAILSEAGDRRVNMSTMRRTIAANMSESLQKAAQLTNVTEVDVTKAVELLKAHKAEKLSLTALVVKACALAIKDHDVINTVVDGNQIIYKAGIHVSVAVDIPGGLTVPVIRNADGKDIQTLSLELASLAGKAKDGTLTQEDLAGGTFTVSNVGMLGVDLFTPVINYPQTAIMGVGAVRRVPRFVDDESDTVVAKFIMLLSLTYDHRVIDGAPAARFSERVRNLLQDPQVLFA